jgi:hypothetical protein
MCFSAEASFAASAVLLPAGIYCTRIALVWRRRALPLAVIPLIFSVQQFAEGFVWLGLRSEDSRLITIASLSFLAVALVVWPVWLPLSVLCLEQEKRRRRCLTALACFALLFGCALYLPLIGDADRWLHVGIKRHSIDYNLKGLPVFAFVSRAWWDACYGVIVFAPVVLASPENRLKGFYLLFATSAVVSFFVFSYAFVSMWCFFAAALSLQLCCIFRKENEPEAKANEPEA